MTSRGKERSSIWVTILLAVLILIPSMYGFVGKFVEFVHVFRGAPEGVFAISPVVNYLCASLGFFCLFIWAARNGMFRDMENPKYVMLDEQLEIDRRSGLGEISTWKKSPTI